MAKECLRKGALVLVGKWARAVICDSDSNIEDWSEVGRAVAKVLSLKGMVLVMPISPFKGFFFVDSVDSALWLEGVGSFSLKGGAVLSL